jgi:type II secretory pathway pseudopilin PulG
MTLIEVLVSLGLSALVVVAGFGLLQSQRSTLGRQTEVGDRQQELWMALELIQRDIRRAGMGFGMCRRTAGTLKYSAHVDCFPSGNTSIGALTALRVNDGGTGGSDSIVINFGEPRGLGMPDTTLAAAVASNVSTIATVANARAVLDPLGCECVGSPACSLPSSPPKYAILYNTTDATRACTLVALTGTTCASNSLSLDWRPALGVYSTTSACTAAPANYVPANSTSYASGEQLAVLSPLSSVVYDIDTSDAARPSLRRSVNGQAAVVAYGIEDLQIVPACDVDGNGFIGAEGKDATGKGSDEWFNNVANDTVTAGCMTFPQVRVSMIARTSNPDPSWRAGSRPALENRTAGTSDTFHRRIIGAVVSAQNLGI